VSDPDLPPRLLQIYRELDGKGDVPWATIYGRVFGAPAPEQIQNYLGPYITRLNRRLAAYKKRVVPGDRKRTYRLTTI
jgi:hypothetical protein